MKCQLVLPVFGVITGLFALTLCTFAQEGSHSPGTPVSMIVTMGSPPGSTVPNVSAQNVSVYQNRTRTRVTDWAPLQSDRRALELFILLDELQSARYGTQLEDLRRFIMAQPSTTKVGVAYSQMGGPKIVQDLTTDHGMAANALHPSLAKLATSASPYETLGQLIEQWPASNDRQEVLMISDGVDETFGLKREFEENLHVASSVENGLSAYTKPSGTSPEFEHNPYVDSTIEKAQRGGVVVFVIAIPGQDIGSHGTSLPRINLSRIAEETGGQFYYYQSAAKVSLAPYLEDLTRRLTRQYLVTFLARPGTEGSLESVKVRTDVPHTELVSAEKVYVPGRK